MTSLVKSSPLRLKAIDEAGVFEGYGSVFNVVDDVRDVVVPGAFAASLARHGAEGTRPKGLWQHRWDCPILTWSEMREDARGLRVRGQLLLDIQQAREAHALMRAGELDGLSIGFECSDIEYARPDEFEQKFGFGLAPAPYAMQPGEKVRVLKGIDLWEVSLVTFPACRPARVETVKAGMPAHDRAALAAALARRQLAMAGIVGRHAIQSRQ